MEKLNFKTFSVKKLLKTILYTVIISVFIGTTTLFFMAILENAQLEIISNLDENSETLIQIGKGYQEAADEINKEISEEKKTYGEDYPAEGIFLYQLISRFSTNRIVQVYSVALTIGIVSGIIIYIVAIQNTSKKQVIIELAIAFVVLIILIMLFINKGYEIILNKAINSINPTNVQYIIPEYIDIKEMLIVYVVIAVVTYIVNIIRQKVLTNRLNKQLHIK